MNPGPNYVYSAVMNKCTVCDKHLAHIRAIGIYLVGDCGAIHYPLCKRCYKVAKKGFAPDQLRKLDQKMGLRAVELGLTQTH